MRFHLTMLLLLLQVPALALAEDRAPDSTPAPATASANTARSTPSKGERQARIVELSIPVFDPAEQSLGSHPRQGILDTAAIQEPGRPQAGASGQRIIGFQAQAIKGKLPIPVGRHDKGQGSGQMWRVAQQGHAFA